MSRRNIILLVVFTVILIIISIATVQKDSEVTEIYLAEHDNLSIDELENLSDQNSFSNTDDIFLYIKVNSIKLDNEIKIIWTKLEKGKEFKVQENKIKPEKDGSGLIIASMIKKDNKIANGNYNVEVFLDNLTVKEKEFVVGN